IPDEEKLPSVTQDETSVKVSRIKTIGRMSEIYESIDRANGDLPKYKSGDGFGHDQRTTFFLSNEMAPFLKKFTTTYYEILETESPQVISVAIEQLKSMVEAAQIIITEMTGETFGGEAPRVVPKSDYTKEESSGSLTQSDGILADLSPSDREKLLRLPLQLTMMVQALPTDYQHEILKMESCISTERGIALFDCAYESVKKGFDGGVVWCGLAQLDRARHNALVYVAGMMDSMLGTILGKFTEGLQLFKDEKITEESELLRQVEMVEEDIALYVEERAQEVGEAAQTILDEMIGGKDFDEAARLLKKRMLVKVIQRLMLEETNDSDCRFKSTPPLGSTPRKVLGLGEDASIDEVTARYRDLMRVIHPDKGGSAYLFHAVKTAYEEICEKERPRHSQSA
ncbi:J domain-containing protein, partial [Brevibacillus laterosporus]|uniref:J domain-containing protein n=3 Tax=Bacilli TaxID=91061 RepID=UPI0022A7D8F3